MTALTHADILELLSVKLPPSSARAGWVIDAKAVVEAKNELSITYPVRFRFITGKRRRGTHYISTNDVHIITLDQNRDIYEANLTLWHELTHCAQVESFVAAGYTADDFHKAYKAHGTTGKRYATNPFEVQANEVAQAHDTVMLLREAK